MLANSISIVSPEFTGFKPFMKSAGGDDVSRIESDETRKPGNLIGNLVRHRAGIIVLSRLAVGPRLYIKVVRIGNLVLGDDPRPDTAMRVLPLGNKLRATHHSTGRDIEERHIPENVIQCFGLRDIFSGLADDESELGFGLINHRGGNVR